jgi:hypothetical protein
MYYNTDKDLRAILLLYHELCEIIKIKKERKKERKKEKLEGHPTSIKFYNLSSMSFLIREE